MKSKPVTYEDKLHFLENPDITELQANEVIGGNEELEQYYKQLVSLRTELSSVNYKFSDGFSQNVLKQLQSMKGKVVNMDFSDIMFRNFKKLAIASAAAIVILLGSLYVTHGSLNLNDVSGVSDLGNDAMASLFLYEY